MHEWVFGFEKLDYCAHSKVPKCDRENINVLNGYFYGFRQGAFSDAFMFSFLDFIERHPVEKKSKGNENDKNQYKT